MKKITLLLSSLILSSIIFGQTNTFPGSGNVGIGTTSPVDNLDIHKGNLYLSGDFNSTTYGTIKFGHSSYSYAWAGISGITNGQGWDQADLAFYTAFGGPFEQMRLMASTGYLGIGTSSPIAKLDVRGDARFGSGQFWGATTMNSSNYLGVRIGIIQSPITNLNSTDAFIGALGTGGPTGLAGDLLLIPRSTTGIPNAIRFYTGPTTPLERLTINSDGKIGIGTTTPQAILDVNGTTYSRKVFVGTPDANTIANMGANNLLAVNGTAVFVKAKVAVYGSAWPDYVFSPGYKTTPLDSLEQFIQLNNHLPDVPSADEVQKDGIDLGDNQALLLKKIEELTLIMIEQDKKINEQNKRIEKLEKEHPLESKNNQ